MLTAMLALMNVTKLWYHSPRPFWVAEDIHAYDCTTQYGNPSGHSLFSMGAAMTIWLDFNDRYRVRNGSFFQPLWVRLIALLVAILFSFTIGYSRIFLGAHAWNQLLFGWQLGLWLALTFFVCYRDSVFYHLTKLHRGQGQDKQKFIVWGIVALVIIFAVETANYLIVVPRIVNDSSWTTNILNKCPNADIAEAY